MKPTDEFAVITAGTVEADTFRLLDPSTGDVVGEFATPPPVPAAPGVVPSPDTGLVMSGDSGTGFGVLGWRERSGAVNGNGVSLYAADSAISAAARSSIELATNTAAAGTDARMTAADSLTNRVAQHAATTLPGFGGLTQARTRAYVNGVAGAIAEMICETSDAGPGAVRLNAGETSAPGNVFARNLVRRWAVCGCGWGQVLPPGALTLIFFDTADTGTSGETLNPTTGVNPITLPGGFVYSITCYLKATAPFLPAPSYLQMNLGGTTYETPVSPGQGSGIITATLVASSAYAIRCSVFNANAANVPITASLQIVQVGKL